MLIERISPVDNIAWKICLVWIVFMIVFTLTSCKFDAPYVTLPDHVSREDHRQAMLHMCWDGAYMKQPVTQTCERFRQYVIAEANSERTAGK